MPTLTATPLKAYPLTAQRLTALRLGELPDTPNYVVQGKSPELVADFYRDYYRADSVNTDFDSLFTFSRTGLATMVDSDGLLKWCPHNLLPNSNDFDEWTLNSGGTGSDPVVTGGQPDPFGGNDAWRLQCDKGVGDTLSDFSYIQQLVTFDGELCTRSVWAKSNNGSEQTITLEVSSGAGSITVTEDWQQFDIVGLTAGDVSFELGLRGGSIGSDQTCDILIYGAHLYRSDLGGMVNNPDRGDSYVPTSGSAVYLPRRGHHVWDGSQWVNKGLLIESEARTNLITHSEDFTDASWTKTRSTITSGALSTSRGFTADKWAESSDNNTHLLETTALLSAAQYTYSILAKASERTGFQVQRVSGDSDSFAHIFDLAAGSASNGGAIKDCGDGWYLCYGSLTHNAASSGGIRLVLRDDGGQVSYAGDGTSGIYIWGAQLEEGSQPSSYVPTSGSTATRAAETLTAPSAGLPWPTEAPLAVSIAMEGAIDYADDDTSAQAIFLRWVLDADEQLYWSFRTDGTRTGAPRFYQESGGVGALVDGATGAYSPGLNVPFSIASRHGSTFINGAVDGVALTANTTPTALPDLSATDLDIAPIYMGTIRTLRVWAQDIGDAGLEEASA